MFAGFRLRVRSYRRAGGELCWRCLIYPGTFRDAEFYALSENGKTPLPRTPESSLKAFDRLMDTASLLARVMDSVKENGIRSIEWAIAAACGIAALSTVPRLPHQSVGNCGRTGTGLQPVAIPKPAVVSELPPGTRRSRTSREYRRRGRGQRTGWSTGRC